MQAVTVTDRQEIRHIHMHTEHNMAIGEQTSRHN